MSVHEIRDFLTRHSLAPHRDRGQNFLVDAAQAARLAALAGVRAGDAVIEVGTGLGILTRALADRGAQVTSVEIDAGLVRALRADAALPPSVELIHADARELDWEALVERVQGEGVEGPRPVRVVANLPYSAATPLLRRWLDLRDALEDWSTMVQREVAERLVAEPGGRDYGSLAVLHRLCVDAHVEMDVHPQSFYPAPRVTSSFVRIVPRADSPVASGELAHVESVVRALFQQRRKTVANTLRRGVFAEVAEAALAAAGIDPRARAETLEPDRLLALARALPAP